MSITCTCVLHAADATWDGDTDSEWTTDSNWTASHPQSQNDDALFDGTEAGVLNLNVGSAISLGSMEMSATQTDSITISGSALTFDNTDATGLAITTHALSGSLTVNNAIVVNNATAGAMLINNNNTVTLTGGISDGGNAYDLNKRGGGILKLGSAGSYIYSGNTHIYEGDLYLKNDLSNTANIYLGETGANASAGLYVDGTSANITANIEVNNINSGTLEIGGANQNPGGWWHYTTFSGDITLNENLQVVAQDKGTVWLTGNISGTGDLIIDASNNDADSSTAGAVRISNNNWFSGDITLIGGYMSIHNANALGDAGINTTTTVNSGGTLEFDGTFTIDQEIFVINGDGVSGDSGALHAKNGNTYLEETVTLGSNSRIRVATGSELTLMGVLGDGGNGYDLIKNGAGILRYVETNTYSGDTHIYAGDLYLKQNLASNTIYLGETGGSSDAGLYVEQMTRTVSADIVVNDVNSGTLTLGGINQDASWSHTATYTGNVILNNDLTTRAEDEGSVDMQGVISGTGALTIDASDGDADAATAGLVILREGNTYSGDTTLIGGILSVKHADALGNSGSDTITRIQDGGTLEFDNPSALDIDNENFYISGSGVNGNQGVLRFKNGDVDIFGTLTLEGHSTLRVDSGGSATLSGAISDEGNTYALTKTGNGALTLEGTSTYSGDTQVDNGTLSLKGELYHGVDGGNVVLNGGTLILDNNNVFSNATDNVNLVLNGGTFQLGNSFSGTLNLGSMTLSADSVIDFGGGSGTLRFASSISGLIDGSNNGLYFLDIWNYSGSFQGGGTDQLFFDSYALHVNELAQIRFWSDDGDTLFGTPAIQLTSNEVVPVPEASTYMGGGLFTLLILGHFLRKYGTSVKSVCFR